ncbi:MAG: amidohydrolase [Anaerolineae bacterium]|nr:amidohydrolase [Anaerolineae bacterium]
MNTDIILYNGRIYTQQTDRPWVSALAVHEGRIVAHGDDDELRPVMTPGSEAVDLGQRLVIPGLVDAHVHLAWYADFLRDVDLTRASSARHAAELVGKRARQTPPGEWVHGRGWSQERWPDHTFPTAVILDECVPDHPVSLDAQSGHALWVNSLALARSSITASTPDPTGGRIARDESGRPTGVLLENAMELVTRMIPRPTPEQMIDRMKEALARANRAGLTGVHDFDGALAFQVFQILKASGDLSLRIVKNIPIDLLDHAVELGLRWGFGDDLLRIGGVKQFADGALGSRTAWMLAPFEDNPDNLGISTTGPQILLDNARRASIAGLPSAIHAIGDRAVREVLDIYEMLRREEAARGILPNQMPHRIEHVQLIDPDDIPRLAKLGIIASMQPIHATSDMEMADRYWGDRADHAYDWRSQLDAGAVLAFGSDAPVEPIEPLGNIQAAVTRRRSDGAPGPSGWRSRADSSGRLTVEEALRGFTIGPAIAAGMGDRCGRLAPGYLADLTVLGQDIFTRDPMTIGETEVLAVMVNGRWVFTDL